jgi:hypothetical protein
MPEQTIRIDEETLKRVAERIKERLAAGNPVRFYIDDAEPRISDHAIGLEVDDWLPANRAAVKLTRCLESIRDMTPLSEFLVLAVHQGVVSKRHMKPIATQLYSLVTGIVDVYGEIQQSHSKNLPKPARKAIVERGKRFDSSVLSGSSLKKIRDKIAAHIDADTIVEGEEIWRSVDLLEFLRILRLCIEELEYLLSHSIYEWMRFDQYSDRFRLMTEDGLLIDFRIEGDEVQSIERITKVKSPRYAVAAEAGSLVTRAMSLELLLLNKERTN